MPQAESLDQALVTVEVIVLQVVEKLPPLTNHLKKPPAGVKILLVHLQVFGQLSDPVGQKSDLNFGRPGISCMSLKIGDQILLCFLVRVQHLYHLKTKIPEPRNTHTVNPSTGYVVL